MFALFQPSLVCFCFFHFGIEADMQSQVLDKDCLSDLTVLHVIHFVMDKIE